jgi:hypothetical protein
MLIMITSWIGDSKGIGVAAREPCMDRSGAVHATVTPEPSAVLVTSQGFAAACFACREANDSLIRTARN